MKLHCKKPCGCEAWLDHDETGEYETVMKITNCTPHSWEGHREAFALAFFGLGALATSIAWMICSGWI